MKRNYQIWIGCESFAGATKAEAESARDAHHAAMIAAGNDLPKVFRYRDWTVVAFRAGAECAAWQTWRDSSVASGMDDCGNCWMPRATVRDAMRSGRRALAQRLDDIQAIAPDDDEGRREFRSYAAMRDAAVAVAG